MTLQGLLLPPLALAWGAVMGSYVATAVVRHTRGEPSHLGRSHCDGCQAPLAMAQTIPVVSYLQRAGRCTTCGTAIDPLHLTGEIAGAAVALASLLLPGETPEAWLAHLLCLGLGMGLLAIALYDLRTLRIPDALTAGVLLLCAALAATRPQGLPVGVACGLVCFLLMEALRRGFQRLHGHAGLGFGDVKLLSALAVGLGPSTAWALVLACVLALLHRAVHRSWSGRQAFGPWIACGGWAVAMALEMSRWP